MTDLVTITRAVEARTGVSLLHMRSPRREKCLVDARVIFSQMARDAGYSYPEIGDFLFKHHSTIMYHIKRRRV